MPINEVTVVRRCAKCRQAIEEITVKKDNMRLMVNDLSWCESCGEETPEVREIAGRQTALDEERASYPGNPPVMDVSAAEYRRLRSAGALE